MVKNGGNVRDVAVVLFFCLCYDLDPVVKPRDDTTALKLCGAGKGEINTATGAVGISVFSYAKLQFYVLLFLFDLNPVFPLS